MLNGGRWEHSSARNGRRRKWSDRLCGLRRHHLVILEDTILCFRETPWCDLGGHHDGTSEGNFWSQMISGWSFRRKKTSFANRDNFPNYLIRWRNHQSVSFFVWLCLQLIQITAKYNLCVLVFCHLPTCAIGTNQPHWYISAPKGKTNPTMRDLVRGNTYHQWPIVLVSNSLILIWVTPFATMHVPAHYPTQTRGQIRSTPFNASVKISQHTCPY